MKTKRKRTNRESRILKSALCLLLIFSAVSLFPKPEVRTQGGNDQTDKRIRVTLEGTGCDLDAIKQDIPFAEFIGERNQAQVAVSITPNKAAGGETVFTIDFTGLGEYAEDNDRIDFTPGEDMSRGDLSAELSNRIQMGLMRYVGKSPQKNQMSVRFMDTVKPTDVVDKWDFWVFSLSANTFFDGQKTFSSRSLYGSVSANRVTPDLKIRMSLGGSFSKNSFSYDDLTIDSKSESLNFNGLVVKSIDEHWSVGAYLGVSSSTYGNTQLSLSPAPAVEYNVFKYSESTERQLRILYLVGFNWVDYREETIFLKTKDRLFKESLSFTFELKQKWGTISTSLEGSHYFHDFSRNRLQFWGDLSLRIAEGLNFNVDLSYSRIHDQLSLPREGASLDEILLRRKELETTYRYRISVGLSFTFGSTRSQIVNPRFGTGSGGIHISF